LKIYVTEFNKIFGGADGCIGWLESADISEAN